MQARNRKCITLILMLLTIPLAWATDEAAEIPDGLGLDAPPVRQAAPPPSPEVIEHLRWSGTPIPLALPVGVDRVVRFPQEVRIGPPGKLLEVLQTTAADGAVYWRALAPFESTLVLVQETAPPGRTYSFYLRGEEGASSAPVEIVAPREDRVENSAAAIAALPAPKGYGYVALTRHAAQQLYAPDRLLRDLPGVYRVPVPDRSTVPLIRTAGTLAEIEATPLASWADEAGIYVTAVRLRNRTHRAVILDPRTALRGEWLAATFQHARLFPTGHEADTTAVYLISARPFADALGLSRRGR